MKCVTFTLVSDGSSDRTLLPIITWLLRQHLPRIPLEGKWADLRQLPARPRRLYQRIIETLTLHPCELLFIHRDAENEDPATRRTEITSAVAAAVTRPAIKMPNYICVIPVRMAEAWLLVDLAAIRKAAGNPNSTQPSRLPPVRGIESLPDPKRVLFQALRAASGLHGRRLKQLDVEAVRHDVADYLQDHAALRQLPAFAQFEHDLRIIVQDMHTSINSPSI